MASLMKMENAKEKDFLSSKIAKFLKVGLKKEARMATDDFIQYREELLREILQELSFREKGTMLAQSVNLRENSGMGDFNTG